MREPRAISCDRGGTLLEQLEFDPHAGQARLLEPAAANPRGATLDTLHEAAEALPAPRVAGAATGASATSRRRFSPHGQIMPTRSRAGAGWRASSPGRSQAPHFGPRPSRWCERQSKLAAPLIPARSA